MPNNTCPISTSRYVTYTHTCNILEYVKCLPSCCFCINYCHQIVSASFEQWQHLHTHKATHRIMATMIPLYYYVIISYTCIIVKELLKPLS